MTLKEFNKQNLNKKAELVWEWGYYLTNCRYGNYNVVIFSMADYFIELCIYIPENRTERVLALRKEDLHSDYICAIRRNTPYMMPETESEQLTVAA